MCSKCDPVDGGLRRPEILRALDAEHAVVDAHGDAPVFGLTDDQLLDYVDSREALRRQWDAVDLAVVRELDGRDVARRAGAAGTAMLLRDRLAIRPGEAHARVQLAAALDGQLGATRQALSEGRVSADHAGVVVSVVRRVPSHVATPEMRDRVESVLLDLARTLDPGELAKAGRALLLLLDPDGGDDDAAKRGKRTLSMHEREDGMTALTAVLDPEGAAVAQAALNPLAAPTPQVDGQRDPRSAGRRRCDALIELCRKVMNDGNLPTTGGERPHVSVLVPFSTLTGDLEEKSGPFGFRGRCWPDAGTGPVTMADGGPAYTVHGGTPLPKTVIDRIVCDASVRRVVFGPKSELLDVGRAQRTATGPIRAAVIARDQLCSFPLCDRPASWTEAHHLIEWNDGGATAADNLALACSVHHDVAHYDGYDLRLGPHGRIEWRAPPTIDPDQTWRTNHLRTARDPYTLQPDNPDP